MRKMILALVVVLIAAPAWGAVTVKFTAAAEGELTIGYDSTGEAELVRAFALDVAVTQGTGTIVDVTNFAVGDDNGGFGIFPANFSRFITVDGQTGEVADWGVAGYTPVADANDTGAAGGLGSQAITLEMGSLYDTAAPAKSGDLCTIVLDGDVKAVCITINEVRGGIVLEDASQAAFDDTDSCIALGSPICVKSDQEKADYAAYIANGADPSCWCNPYQCDGDADGKTQGFAKERVMTNDLSLIIDNWKRKIASANPCADIDHKAQGFAKERVMTNDLAILIANWKKKDAALPGDCPR